MASLIYTLYKAFTATTDGAVSVTMVRSCKIKGIQWSVQPDLDADGEIFSIELSKAPILGNRIHDSQGVLSCICGCCSLTTSGVGITDYNLYQGVDIPIGAGEKLYLNGLLTGTTSVPATCIVFTV